MLSLLLLLAAVGAAFVAAAQLVALRHVERGSVESIRARGSIASAIAFALLMIGAQKRLSDAWSSGLQAAAWALMSWSILLTFIANRRGRPSEHTP
jgi:ABC-type methionine transport system permease subunit